jgi:hypothetical protein
MVAPTDSKYESSSDHTVEVAMHELIYLVGLVVVVMFVLSLLGLR